MTFVYRKASCALASLLATTALVTPSFSHAQQSLPTIDIGSARARNHARPASVPASSSRPTTGAVDPANRTEKPVRSSMPDKIENFPAVVSTFTRQQIRTSVNAMTTAETLRYMPSIFVLERYIGDPSTQVSTRTTANNTNADVLVYADNVLLSNLLGNASVESIPLGPRWMMISPFEIDRIDVMYGPFSALYPGNSNGGVVTITTRMPEKFELHASGLGSLQTFGRYGYNQVFPAGRTSIGLGNKINDFSFWLTYDYLGSQGNPMYFGTNLLAAPRGVALPVAGGVADLDPQGRPRIVTGTFVQDDTRQQLAKGKFVYELAPGMRATYLTGLWTNLSDYGFDSFLRNAAGFPVYNTPNQQQIAMGDLTFNAPAGFSPGHANATHLMQALSVKRETGVFDFEIVGTGYDFLRDNSNFQSAYGLSLGGRNTINSGTYWRTLDARANWRPDYDMLGKHEVSFGAHADVYSLGQMQTNVPAFPNNFYTSVQAINYGKTQTQGVYVQDIWQFHPQWRLFLGGRGEFWHASGGMNQTLGTRNSLGIVSAPNYFAVSDKGAFSPKAAIEFRVTEDFSLRGSMGRAYRFPGVNELFRNIASPTGVNVGNPNLQTEVFTAYDLTGEYTLRNLFGAIGYAKPRISLFNTDRWNAIFSQTGFATGIPVTQLSNIGKANIRGVEGVVDMKDVAVEGLDFLGSLTLVDAKILSNWQNPLSIGMQYPRIPPVRARAVASWRPNADSSLSLGMTYGSAAYGNLTNDDYIRSTFGSASTAYLFVDAKANYYITKEWTLTAGVNNIGNYKANAFHNLPHRTYFFGLNYDFVGETPRTLSDLHVIPGG